MVNVALVARSRIDIGIGAQPLMHLPAKQFVNGFIRFLADDVPARHFQRGEHTHQGQVGVLGKSTRIHPAPHRFDVMRIIASDIACEHILNHLGDQMRLERNAISLANARHAAIGRQLHKNKIPPAKVRRRVPDDEGFNVG